MPIQFPWLDQPHLCSGVLLRFSDEYDLAELCRVCVSFRCAAAADFLWKPHLARRSPALASTAYGNCRSILAQLELANPRRCISDFRFCVDVRAGDDGPFVFSAIANLRTAPDGTVKETRLQNLVPDNNHGGLPFSLSAQLNVLDKRGNLFVFNNVYATSSRTPTQQTMNAHFLSKPIAVGGCEHEKVVLVSLLGTRHVGNDRLVEWRLSASCGAHVPLQYDYEDAGDDDMAVQSSIEEPLASARADSSERSLVEALTFLRKQRALQQ